MLCDTWQFALWCHFNRTIVLLEKVPGEKNPCPVLILTAHHKGQRPTVRWLGPSPQVPPNCLLSWVSIIFHFCSTGWHWGRDPAFSPIYSLCWFSSKNYLGNLPRASLLQSARNLIVNRDNCLEQRVMCNFKCFSRRKERIRVIYPKSGW